MNINKKAPHSLHYCTNRKFRFEYINTTSKNNPDEIYKKNMKNNICFSRNRGEENNVFSCELEEYYLKTLSRKN